MKTNDGAWAALTPDAAPGVSFVTNAPLEAPSWSAPREELHGRR